MRTWKTLAAAAALVAGLAGAPAADAQAPVKVKQAGFKVIDLAVPFIAKSEGFFEKNGLDWEYVEIDSGKLGVAGVILRRSITSFRITMSMVSALTML